MLNENVRIVGFAMLFHNDEYGCIIKKAMLFLLQYIATVLQRTENTPSQKKATIGSCFWWQGSVLQLVSYVAISDRKLYHALLWAVASILRRERLSERMRTCVVGGCQ